MIDPLCEPTIRLLDVQIFDHTSFITSLLVNNTYFKRGDHTHKVSLLGLVQ